MLRSIVLFCGAPCIILIQKLRPLCVCSNPSFTSHPSI
jgi:hypothetical protein